MRVRALAVAATAALIGLSVALPAPAARADTTHWFFINLFAREDVGPHVTVQLLDASSVDVAPACGRGAMINPDYDDWRCQIADEAHTLVVTAPASISIDIQCVASDLSVTESFTGTILIPATPVPWKCTVFTMPDTSWPSVAQVELVLSAPAAELASAHVALVDSGGTERGCAEPGPGQRLCSDVPYGTYSIVPVGLPAGSRSSTWCTVVRTSIPFWESPATLPITVDPSVIWVSCSVTAALPQVAITGFYPWDGPPPTFALHPTDGGDDVACTTSGPWSWICLPPGPGTYQLVTDLVPSPQYPQWYGCRSTGGSEPAPGSGFPPAFVFAESDVDWYQCTFFATEPPPPPTYSGPDQGDGVLVSSGGGGSVWPLALLLLVAGGAMTRLARRPVR